MIRILIIDVKAVYGQHGQGLGGIARLEDVLEDWKMEGNNPVLV